MSATRYIKPAPGRTVRRPEQGFKVLPAEGALVTWSPYYERLLADGDVVQATEPKAQGPKTQEEKS